MTGTPLGVAFLAAVRTHFARLFARHGFKEVGEHDDWNLASLTVMDKTHYLRISNDVRDNYVDASLGRLTEGVVPPVRLAPPPRTPSDVREIPVSILAWVAAGDKKQAFALGLYPAGSADGVSAAVGRLAEALEKYGDRLLAGDQREWDAVAEVAITRTLRR